MDQRQRVDSINEVSPRQAQSTSSYTSIKYIIRDIKERERRRCRHRSHRSLPSFSSSLSSTKSSASKSPLREPRTPETVSQYSFHIVNAAVTRLRTSALIHRGFGSPDPPSLLPSPSLSSSSSSSSSFVPPSSLSKDGYYLRETKVPSFIKSPSYLFIFTLSERPRWRSSSFSQFHLSFRSPPIFTHLLRHRRSNAAHKFAAKLAKFSLVDPARAYLRR